MIGLRLKLPHTSYFSLSNQAEKGRVFYLVNKGFETGGDSRNFCDFQNRFACGEKTIRSHLKENFIYFQMYLPKGKQASQLEKLPLDAKQSTYLLFYLDLSSWRAQDG